MTIEIKKMGAEAVIELCGRLDTPTEPVLDKTIGEDISETTNLT
jgi:anti-anti-sigma regulatory factor